MITRNIKQLWNKLWWRWMPGCTVKVRWPVGEIRLRQEASGISAAFRSADPHDHYGPWLTEHAGRQGLDWNWDLRDNDATENRLTIKFRRGRSDSAVMAALMWS